MVLIWLISVIGLNPCYNGMTIECEKRSGFLNLESLNPCYNGMTIEFGARRQGQDKGMGLNPCYNGMTIESMTVGLCMLR